MCTVTINIDEAKLRSINPELDGTEAISRWLQDKVNLWMSQNAPAKSTFDFSHLHPDLQRILASQKIDAGEVGLNGEIVRDEYYQEKYNL